MEVVIIGSIWLGAILAYLFLWWIDNPDSNPYAVNRLYRAVIGALLAVVVGMSLAGMKAVSWHRNLRTLILERCQ